MEQITIKANHRSVTGKQVKAMRRAGQLPAVLYGYDVEPTPITLDFREASRLLGPLASSTLIQVELDGVDHLALVREKQRNFITGLITHVDFQAVSSTEEIRVAVPVEVRGESAAMKDYNGVMVMGLEEIEVEALPQNLPERIVVDISSIKRIGDAIYVRDLQVPENVTVWDQPDEMVVLVTGQAAEEVEEAPVAAPAAEGTEPEVIERGKKEEEEEA